MPARLIAVLIAALLAAGPTVAHAQGTTTAKPAAAKTTAAKAAADEDDEPSSAAQKKSCDAKWKTEKDKTGAKGWKAYFTFMAKCM